MSFYFENKKKNKIKLIFSVILSLVLIFVLVNVWWIRKQNEIKFDDTILGSSYAVEDMYIPTPTPTPTQAPVKTEASIKQKFPSELVSVYKRQSEKTAYLTFDDGPTTNVTPRILDILKEKNVQATFFVLGANVEKHPDVAKRIADEGHLLANHSYSHDYKALYKDTETFLNDVKKAEQIILNTVGEQSYEKIFRFPGGSFESKKDKQKEVLFDEGYVYVDWNAINGDAEGHDVAPSKLLQNVKKTTQGHFNVVVLMHDAATKKTTADALPDIIDYLSSEGYVFKTLSQK